MQFLNPDVFYMMLIPLLLLIILIFTSKKRFEQFFSKQILSKLQVYSSYLSHTTRNVFLFLTLIFFIVALGRPVIDEKEHTIDQELIPVVIALDVSKSMQAKDIFPSRIMFAKQKLKAFVENFSNTTIGIVLFAKDAMILSPVTEDFTSLQFIIQNIDTSYNFANGSNIQATLATAQYMFEDFEVKNLIILSDGGNAQNYEDEIEYAKNKNIRIYAVGLATPNGAAIPDQKGGYITNDQGDIVTVKLNSAIKNLALETKGGYIDYTLDSQDVLSIVQRINTQSQKQTFQQQNIKTYTELFYYPLGLGLLCLLIALSSLPPMKNRSSSLGAVVFLVIFFFGYNSSLNAFELDFEKIEKAKQYYDSKQYEQAAQEYRNIRTTKQSLYNLGNSLYKQEKYQEAIDVYSKVITNETNLEHKKLHNIGNSYVKLQDLQKAKEFYEKALKVKYDEQTKQNLEKVNESLQKEQEKQEQEKQKKKNDQTNNQKEQKNNDQKKDNQEKKQETQKRKNEQEKEDGQKKQMQNQQEQSQKKEEEISKTEEKKWLNQLQEEKKSPVLIYKAPIQDQEDSADETDPW